MKTVILVVLMLVGLVSAQYNIVAYKNGVSRTIGTTTDVDSIKFVKVVVDTGNSYYYVLTQQFRVVTGATNTLVPSAPVTVKNPYSIGTPCRSAFDSLNNPNSTKYTDINGNVSVIVKYPRGPLQGQTCNLQIQVWWVESYTQVSNVGGVITLK